MKKRWLSYIVLLLVVGAVLAACTAEPETIEVTRVVTETVVQEGETVEITRVVTETEVEQVEVTRVVTEEVIVEVEAEPEPVDRMGGWLDTIIMIEEPNQDAAVARLSAGDFDVFADDISGAAAVSALADPNLQTRVQYGLYDELTFNTGTCTDENLLNPFTNQKIREAMNWAIDRDYVADELYQGLAVPKYTAISEAGADRARFAAEIRAVEAPYAYDFDRANEVISAEMESMGATLENGVWTYAGEPINIIFLIRIEDARLDIGNYIANQLEDMGFTVERVERVAGELSPLWIGSNPADCLWTLYTGAWSQTAVERSSVDNFDDFYTPRGTPWPLWQTYTPPADYDALALRLATNDFASMEERSELAQQAFPIAAELANRVWITSRTTLVPFRNNVDVASDLAAGVSGSAVWAKTIRYVDEVGGSMTIGIPSVLTEPYNPVGGTNWVFDAMVQRGVGDPGLIADPFTGLRLPNRVERAEVVVQEGFPMGVTLDWVELTTAPEIVVPDDAWVDWDAENQVFLTAGEVYTEPQTSVFKSTVYYPADMFEKVTWHDGSHFSVGDVVMGIIQTFDYAKEASPNYDESLVPTLQQFQAAFKGLRIISTDPLVIEHYGDDASLDAENSVYTWMPVDEPGGAFQFGDAAWHNMALMQRGDAAGLFAFTPEKAEANEIQRVSLVAGPTLENLAAELEAASAEGYIPWAPTMSQFVTAEEAATRYANLAEFARRYGHYYVATGPYFLQGVFAVEGQLILKHYDAYPDSANRWARFGAPAIPVVEVDGDSRVTIGDEASFDVFIDVFGGAYPVDDIDSVSYLLFDATGVQVDAGAAEAVEDGLWQVTLSGDITSGLVEGSNSLDIVVVSKRLAIPTVAGFSFVSAP